MATTTTRILLRNDTAANWASSSLQLFKGEVAIDSTNGLMRMGLGGTTWTNSLPIGVAPEQISSIIQDYSKEYQIVSTDTNVWQLQSRPLSGGDWTNATGTISVDFSSITDAIDGLTADIDYLSGQIDATNETLNTVSSDYLKSADFTTLSDALTAEADARSTADSYLSGQIDATNATLNTVSSDYVKATDFAALSNEIGLSAASASNTVVTQKDIADLAGAMHFVGPITLNEGETVAEAVARLYPDHTATGGDIVIDTATSKEYLYTGSNWIELGDEVLYATKAEVATVSADLSTDYVGKIADALSTAEGYADDISTALSTDYQGKIDALSDAIDDLSGDYATKEELSDVSVALSTDYVGKISTAKDEAIEAANGYTDGVSAALSADYQGKIDGLTADVEYLSGQISSIADTYATKEYVNGISTSLSSDYTGKIDTLSVDFDGKIDGLSGAVDALVADVSAETLVSANAYTDEQIAALSIDDYIKNGECTQEDLSGYFIFDCGGASLREGEPTSI